MQKLHPRVSGDLSQRSSAFHCKKILSPASPLQGTPPMAGGTHQQCVCQSLCSNLNALKVHSRLAAQVTLPHVMLSSNTASQCVSVSVSSSPPATLSLFCMPPLNYQHGCRCFLAFTSSTVIPASCTCTLRLLGKVPNTVFKC